MKKILGLISLIIILAACTGKDKLPEGILPRDKMEAILWDLLRASEFLNGYVLNKDSTLDRKATVTNWYDHVFALHKVSRTAFEKSYVYYREHPVLMNEILDSLNQISYRRDTSGAPVVDTAVKGHPNFPAEALNLHDSFRKRRLVRPFKDSVSVK
jgi:hypothetical protein